MELSELEEWCANELAGMSKSRILSILHGTPMSGSSATSESDDSGPSLEIISDTEEWLSDDEPTVKQEPLSPGSKSKKLKSKRKAKPPNKKDDKPRKGKIRPTETEVKVKKEKDKTEPKNQEGESLLDLLELEMRARAIRALIRKEEDVIPDSEKSTSTANTLKSTLDSVVNAKNKLSETSETLVEKIGEDEDVVLLVKPTPTIELISSDSETECNVERINKKLENERNDDKSTNVGDSTENIKSPENLNTTESDNTVNPIDTEKQTFRKLKRRPQLRTKSKSLSDCDITGITVDTEVKSAIDEKIEKSDEKIEEKIEKIDKISEDNEEIIDLDDYPDDMYNIEPDETVTNESENKNEDDSQENWATRYYQTDSVQNVIKESKIQSEIRKRLRERQRLSKLNNSPKEQSEENDNIKIKPTGSVDEYFALKNMTNSQTIEIESSKDQPNEQSLPVSKEEVNISISSSSTLPQDLSSLEVTKLTVTTETEVNKL